MPASKSFFRNCQDQTRLALVVVDGEGDHVRAHFNPHEVQIERAGGWEEKPIRGQPHLQYGAEKARTMTLELLFDCFEIKGETLDDDLDALGKMMVAPAPGSRIENRRRPPILQVINGPIPGFRCIVESLAIKVTMFDKQMKPVRATASIKLKEAGPAGDAKLDVTSIPRENYLEWTKAEQQDRYREEEVRRREVEVAKIGGLE